MKVCPLCGSKRIRLTDVTAFNGHVSVRLYCPKCKRGMTVTGTLVYTGEEVEG